MIIFNRWWFIYFVRKIFRKSNISYPLVRTRTCAYQRVRNVSFSESFANVINEWSLGYYTDSNVHPYNLNEEWDSDDGEPLPRPGFAVYGRMAEKTESVAFRKKFYDWPDPVDLKVKTVEAKVHAQVFVYYYQLKL